MFARVSLVGERTVALSDDLCAEVGGRGALLSGDQRVEVGENSLLLSGDPRAAVLVDADGSLSDEAGAAGLVGGAALSVEPGADAWWWLFDPLGDAWWDPADTGAEPDVEVDPRLEALLGAPGREHGARAWMPLPAAPSLEGALAGGSPAPAPGVEADLQAAGRLAVAPGVGSAAEAASPPVWLSASCLAAIVPGSGLAAVLERVDLASADDELLVETVAAGERQAVFDHLLGALAAGELSRRASMNPLWHPPVPSRTCVAGDELAMRLGWSRPAATRLVRDGRALAGVLLPVADAVRDGLLDTAKLRVLTDRLADRAHQLSWPVLDQVLPDAATRTPTQLAADVDRALLAADPADAAIRLPKAIAARHVCHPRRLPDGMAGLWAVLPATDAARIDGTLEATARAARAAGDPRTLDQLRADTLTDLATGTALLAGAAVMPGGNGVGGDARATTSDAALGSSLVAPADDTGQETDGIDHTPDAAHRGPDKVDHETDSVEPEQDASPTDQARPSGRAAPGIRIPKVRIDVTVALSTLMGLDDQPAELAGLGPIPAEQARALAAGGLWRRIVTDPLTGTVLDVGRTRYRPPAGLAEHVLARDQVCAGPGCCVPGHRCDIDHTTEYHGVPANGSPERGSTSADNLGPLSNRCHRLKTDGGFTLRQITPGVFEWHTPAGLTYRVTPGDHGHTEKLDNHPHTLPNNPPF